MAGVDEKYHTVLQLLVKKIKGSRQRVATIANSELLTVYWEIGKILLEQREKEGWGKKIIEMLSRDLKAEFPNMGGFSQRNLEYMQTFASNWPHFPFPRPPAAQLKTTDRTASSSITQEPIAQLQNTRQSDNAPIPQQPAAELQSIRQLDGASIPQEPVVELQDI